MATPSQPTSEKRLETGAFAFLAFVLVPVLTVFVVGVYGFLVWIWQMIHGPPGPPPT